MVCQHLRARATFLVLPESAQSSKRAHQQHKNARHNTPHAALTPELCRVHKPQRELPMAGRTSSVAFSPSHEAQLLCCASPNSTVALWNCEAAAEVRSFAEHSARVLSLSFSPVQPHAFASASEDRTVRLWSTRQARSTLVVDLQTNVCCVAMNPWDEHMFAAGTAGHSMYVFDQRHVGKPLAVFPGAPLDL